MNTNTNYWCIFSKRRLLTNIHCLYIYNLKCCNYFSGLEIRGKSLRKLQNSWIFKITLIILRFRIWMDQKSFQKCVTENKFNGHWQILRRILLLPWFAIYIIVRGLFVYVTKQNGIWVKKHTNLYKYLMRNSPVRIK